MFTYGGGADRARAYFVGQTGEVAPFADCEWVEESKDTGWECRGVFTGGGLRVDDVRIRPRLDELPTGPGRAIVSGPGATMAWTDTSALLLIPGVFGLAIALFGPFVTVHVYGRDMRDFVRRRRRRREIAREIAAVRRDLRAARDHLNP